MIFWIIGSILYAFFGVINAMVISICIVEDNFKCSNPLEYWLALIVAFLIWPFFFVRAVVESIKDKKNGKH